MPEKKFTRLTIEIAEEKIELLKGQLRSAGVSGHVSATEAVTKALELYGSTSKSVRLDEPERREIESRTGATVPLRNSRDILRAFEKMTGGPDAVVLDLDPGVADVMRDVGHGLGYGLAEFTKIVVEDAYTTAYLHTVEMRQLFFSPSEFKRLQETLKVDRIPSGGALVGIILEALKPETDPCPSTITFVPAAS